MLPSVPAVITKVSPSRAVEIAGEHWFGEYLRPEARIALMVAAGGRKDVRDVVA
jgi:hypothetical protein